MRLGNSQIPAPGSTGKAKVCEDKGRIRVVEVELYAPGKPDPIILPGCFWPGDYPDEEAARQAISKDLEDNLVKIDNLGPCNSLEAPSTTS